MNFSECPNGTSASVLPTEVASDVIVATVILALIDLVVIIGNSLVVAAVITTRKLRTVTNIFIVSLAVADLLLGCLVLPFSIALEVLDVWIFGNIWCTMWLAIDVWLCTASILNLCAISLDRYLAVTRPIRYHSIVSKRRGRILLSVVWILSFIICLPPLLGWNEPDSEMPASASNTSSVAVYSSSSLVENISPRQDIDKFSSIQPYLTYNAVTRSPMTIKNTTNCLPIPSCGLTPTRGYRIYAALGSFFVPMFVMVFFYFQIYRAAVRTASSIRNGVLTTKACSDTSNNMLNSEAAITLRIHTGRSVKRTQSDMDNKHPSCGRPKGIANSSTPLNRGCVSLKEKRVSRSTSKTSIMSFRRFRHRSTKERSSKLKESQIGQGLCNSSETKIIPEYNGTGSMGLPPPQIVRKPSRNSQKTSQSGSMPAHIRTNSKEQYIYKDGKLQNIKSHIRKFRRETKAAKTLAIIVGAFIICWLPFFTIYLAGAFCPSGPGCISPLTFSIMFWLGYCNSALNPCIYALFSRDFRFAFKRLLVCGRRFKPRIKRSEIGSRRFANTLPLADNESTSDS